MSVYNIIVVNTDPECDCQIEKIVDVTGPTTYILRLQVGSTADGPFNVYVGSTGTTPIYSAVTKTEINNGLVLSFDFTPTPTPTVSPSSQTPTVTPTYTTTPSITPTNTLTASVSLTPGLSPSVTPTITLTSSVTPTKTVTPTITPTTTVTPTKTITPTTTPTNSVTPTNTVTPTSSVTPTKTNTPTTTPTTSITPTKTITPTLTPTKTITPTTTNTPTTTPTNTITPTTSLTPTSTITPTITPTNSVTITPTLTSTPTNTPLEQFFAYLFPEALDSTSLNNLGQYMYDSGSTWFGFGNSGIPGTTDYSSNLDNYAHFSGFTGSVGNFITDVETLRSNIRQVSGSGTDTYGCSQNQYTFGSIRVTTSQVNPNIYYFYSVWIPLNGVGGTMNNMTLDVGLGSACSTNIINDGLPDSILSQSNVIVTSGAAIPSGTYRVLWMYPQMQIPPSIPLNQSIFIKGDTKT